MFSDLDLIKTIDDDDEVPEDPDSASDDEAVSSLYSSDTLTNSQCHRVFLLACVVVLLCCLRMYHVNTMFRGVNYHGKLLFAMVVLHFEPYTMVKPRFLMCIMEILRTVAVKLLCFEPHTTLIP